MDINVLLTNIENHKVHSPKKIKLIDIPQMGRFMALWQAWEWAQASREAQAQGRVG